jgi:drug/metabolite transporter, DME family
MTAQGRAALAVVGAAALFGTSATATELLAPDAPSAAVAALRLLIGSAGLILVVWVTGHRHDLWVLWRKPIVWLMGAGVAGYQAMFFIGTSRTGVAIGTLASLALAPFLAGLLGWLLREGAPGWVWAGSTVVAIIGVAFLTLGDAGTADRLGIAAAATAGACYAVYTVLGARLARDGHRPTSVLAASFAVGAIALVPFAVSAGTWWLNASGVLYLAWLGLVATTGAYILFGIGLKVLQPGHIATLNLAEPVVATLLGVLLIGEILGAGGWIGAILVLIALAMLGILENRRPKDVSTHA